MNEAPRGSAACWLCGIDSPHSHRDYEVANERERPKFEAAMRSILKVNPFFRNLITGNSMGTTPQEGWGDGPMQSYPEAFGWGVFDKQKTFGGDDAYGLGHWAHRASYRAPYHNEGVECLWQLWRLAMESKPGGGGHG